MDFRGKNLVDWLRKQPKEQFPSQRLYIGRYDQLDEFLRKNVHPHVGTGAALAGKVFLNDHGPDHVAMVIQRASEMLAVKSMAQKSCVLIPYEAYLLLAAIQVHDIGNIFGRQHHEVSAAGLPEIEQLLGDESIEKRLIYGIAAAHGGAINGDPDTIYQLQQEDMVLNRKVRPRLLAALLRFADEIADDRTRAGRFAATHGVVPEEGLIFHKYSECLHSVVVDVKGRAVDLHFEIPEDDAKVTFTKKKGEAPIYLLDEIISRTIKMHHERVYCMRYMRPYVNLDSINVKVRVWASPPKAGPFTKELKKIGYRLEDRGYPEPNVSLPVLCPELKKWFNNAPLSGSALAAFLQQGGDGNE